MGTEFHSVNGRLMQVAGSVYEGPFTWTGLSMDEDGSVKGAGSEDNAKFGVGPGYFPDRAFVAL